MRGKEGDLFCREEVFAGKAGRREWKEMNICLFNAQ